MGNPLGIKGTKCNALVVAEVPAIGLLEYGCSSSVSTHSLPESPRQPTNAEAVKDQKRIQARALNSHFQRHRPTIPSDIRSSGVETPAS
jgi:hypothetical protein